MEVWYRLISLLIGYGFGLFQTAIVIGKIQGFDIRKVGSGNAGTTNMLRTKGAKDALLTLIGDFMKAVCAVLIVQAVFAHRAPQMIVLLKMYAGVGAVLGHDFPFYLRFKGGKGVATTAGVIAAISPLAGILCIVFFFILFFSLHLVSVCSLSAYSFFFLQVLILGALGRFHMAVPYVIEMDILATVLTGLCFWQHRSNIRRLMRGEEKKVYLHRSLNEEVQKGRR